MSGRPKKQTIDGKRQCSMCREWLPVSKFGPNKIVSDGLEVRCKPCSKDKELRRRGKTLRNYMQYLAHTHRQLLTPSGNANRPARCRRLGADSCICTDVLLELWKSQHGRCAITGEAMTRVVGQGRVPTNVSIDRIDSTRGYVRDNVQLVCHVVNLMKSDLDNDGLLFWASKVVHGLANPTVQGELKNG